MFLEYGQRTAVYAGYDACFNNKKYGMPNGEFGDYNVMDTPYTPYSNCFYMDYTMGVLQTTSCYTAGLQLRIKTMDPVDLVDYEASGLNQDYIRDPSMYVEAEFTNTGEIFQILSTDASRILFWVYGEHNPRGVYIETLRNAKDYSLPETCVSEYWAGSIDCLGVRAYCTSPTDVLILRVAVRTSVLYHEVECQ